jgi:hypothetical protein
VPSALAAARHDEPQACEKRMRAPGHRHEDAWYPALPSAMPFPTEIVTR